MNDKKNVRRKRKKCRVKSIRLQKCHLNHEFYCSFILTGKLRVTMRCNTFFILFGIIFSLVCSLAVSFFLLSTIIRFIFRFACDFQLNIRLFFVCAWKLCVIISAQGITRWFLSFPFILFSFFSLSMFMFSLSLAIALRFIRIWHNK